MLLNTVRASLYGLSQSDATLPKDSGAGDTPVDQHATRYSPGVIRAAHINAIKIYQSPLLMPWNE